MKQVEAKFLRMSCGFRFPAFVVDYMFLIDKQAKNFHLHRFLKGNKPNMNTWGILYLTDNDEIIKFEYDGGVMEM